MRAAVPEGVLLLALALLDELKVGFVPSLLSLKYVVNLLYYNHPKCSCTHAKVDTVCGKMSCSKNRSKYSNGIFFIVASLPITLRNLIRY